MFEFEDIVNSTNVYLCAKDKNFKYLYCNENVAQGLGLDSPQQIIGKTDYELFPHAIANMYRAGDISTLKGNVLLNVREIQPHTNKVIEILTTKNTLRDKQDNTFVGIAVSSIDITGLTCNIPTDIMQYVANEQSYKFKIGAKEECFTPREYEVFKRLLLGLTAKQIAKQLTLSPRTVEDYIKNIKRILQCTSKHHIIEAAMRYGIVQQNILTDLN